MFMWGIKTKTMKVYDSLNNTSINADVLIHFHLIYLLSEEFAMRDGDEYFQPSCLGLNKLLPLRTFFYPSREESGQKSKVSTATPKGHMDLDGPLFHRNGTKGDGELNHSVTKQTWCIYEAFIVTCFSAHLFRFLDDSDSDSELSVDEHSSSYASSNSSDSEDDDIDVKPKWNNERQPVHSTPKGMYMLLKDGRREINK